MKRAPLPKPWRLWVGLLLSAFLMLPAEAFAADKKVDIEVRREQGFARLVLTFPKTPKVTTKTVSTIFISKFEQPFSVDLRSLPTKLSSYLTVARNDPDGRGFRFAMKRGFKVNVHKAGTRLVIDILNMGWRGPPPGLPQDVIDALAADAEAARKRADELARSEALALRPLLVKVSHANQPTFNRIKFSWNRFVTAAFTRRGDEVIITFDGRAIPDLARLRINPPRALETVRHELLKKQLKIILQIKKGTKVRAFREGKNYIVDLTWRQKSKLSDTEEQIYAATRDESGLQDGNGDGEEIELFGDDPVSLPAPKPEIARAPSPPVPSRSGKKPLPISPKNPPPPVRKNGPANASEIAIIEQPPVAAIPSEAGGQVLVLPESKLAESQQTEQQQAAPQRPADAAPRTAQQSPPPVQQKREEVRLHTGSKVAVNRENNSVKLVFPYKKSEVSAAIFQRGHKLWVLIDSPKKLDINGLQEQLGGIVRSIGREDVEGGQLFTFRLSEPWLSSVAGRHPNWNVNIGELVTNVSDDIQLSRQKSKSGTVEIFAPLKPNGRLHFLRDTDSGDELTVLTAPAPARTLRKRREYIDFVALPTIHGVAVRPLADDLQVVRDDNGLRIGRAEGLRVSGSKAKMAEAAKQNPLNKRRTDARKLDFTDPDGENPGAFGRKVLQLERKLARTKGRQRKQQYLDYVRHLLAHGFSPESLGLLNLVAGEQEEIGQDPVFRLMRGMSNVMLGRYKHAADDLQGNDLKDNPHAALWRGLKAFHEGNFERAIVEMKRGQSAIEAYLPRQQGRFRLAMAEAALKQNELILTGSELDKMPREGLTDEQKAMMWLLEGQLKEAQNRVPEAIQQYTDAIRSDVRPVTAKAVFHLTDLRLRLGILAPKDGIEMLQRLSLVWRGDDLELKVMHRLADLYLEQGKFDEAFTLMHAAVRAHPEAKLAMSLQDRMKDRFKDLFLRGKADQLEPIKALALFYDHKSLTPPGRRGDEMIRLLADRLIGVDLLDKAADLLDYQVTRRLKGAGRAQVAIRLAMIHLLQHQPKKALHVLHKTRQSKLPQQVSQARKILEARAFAELGRSGSVLELLATDDSAEAGEIKSLALWNAQQWIPAGEQYERSLGVRWQKKDELLGEERMRVLRAAIAYTLGGDKLGLQRIRDKYQAKMEGGPDAAAFKMITDPLEAQTGAIDKLAREIADIDTLEAFAKAFKQKFDESGPDSTSAIKK